MATRQEIMREIDNLNKTIEDTNLRKEEALLNLGILVYQKVREGLLENDEIDRICEPIIGFDHVIYDSKVKIHNYKKQLEGIKCSCGANLNPEDRFCGTCGKKVELPVDNIEYITCERCLSDIDRTSTFCPCCGIKLFKLDLNKNADEVFIISLKKSRK